MKSNNGWPWKVFPLDSKPRPSYRYSYLRNGGIRTATIVYSTSLIVTDVPREYIRYRQTSTISRTLVGNEVVGHSDVGAAPTLHLHSRHNIWFHWMGTTRRDEKHLRKYIYIPFLNTVDNRKNIHDIYTTFGRYSSVNLQPGTCFTKFASLTTFNWKFINRLKKIACIT